MGGLHIWKVSAMPHFKSLHRVTVIALDRALNHNHQLVLDSVLLGLCETWAVTIEKQIYKIGSKKKNPNYHGLISLTFIRKC